MENICERCIYKKICGGSSTIANETTVITGCSRFEECTPFTNADRIRAMTDEELALWVASICYNWEGKDWNDWKKRWLEWLKQEVDSGADMRGDTDGVEL